MRCKMSYEKLGEWYKKRIALLMQFRLIRLHGRIIYGAELMKLREKMKITQGSRKWIIFEVAIQKWRLDCGSTRLSLRKRGEKRKMRISEFSCLRKSWSRRNNSFEIPNRDKIKVKRKLLRWWRSWVKSKKDYIIRKSSMKWWSSKQLIWPKRKFKSWKMSLKQDNDFLTRNSKRWKLKMTCCESNW